MGGTGIKKKSQKCKSPDPIDTAMIQFLEDKKKRMQTDEQEDADSSFMKYCLLQMKRLPEKTCLEAKLEIINVLYRKVKFVLFNDATGTH